MYRAACYAFCFCALVLGGCHVHPLHQDVTELSTADLVHKIQCEAADFIRGVHPAKGNPDRLKKLKIANDAIRNKTKKINELSESIPAAMDKREVDETKASIRLQARQLKQALAENPSPTKLETIIFEAAQLYEQWKALKVVEKALTDRAAAAEKLQEMLEGRTTLFGDIIAFEANLAVFGFVFTITESNDASAGATGIWPIPLGTITLTGSLSDKRSRLGERKVTLVLAFGELNKFPCGPDPEVDRLRAHRYPITGTIGLAEVFDQYMRLVKTGSSFGTFATDTGGKSFSDKIAFTTEVGGTLKPSLAKKTSTHTLNANLDLAATRKDVHELTMLIRSPESGGRAVVVPVQEIVIRRLPGARVIRMPP